MKVYIIYDAYWGLFELDEVLIYTSKQPAEKKYKELIEQNRYNEESHYMLIEKETDTEEKNAEEGINRMGMIKVRLRLELRLDEDWDEELQKYVPDDVLLDYDKETWKDGNVFEFPDLRSAEEFRRSCPIDFKPEVYAHDSQWTYHYVETHFDIDTDNDELVLVVDAGEGWED